MKGLFLIEPLVALYSFASFLVLPLVQQYVYRRLWQELTNTTYPVSANASRCGPSNTSSHHEDVQKAASLFSLYSELFSMIPSVAVTLILVSYSDQRGRKITIVLPLIGSLVYALSFLAVSFFELNVYLLIVSSFVSALFGGLGTFLGGCFSYVADLCEDGQQKTLRMAGVDMVIGLLSGLASISTGYFLQAAGFNWPLFTVAILHCVNLLYAVFVLEESLKPAPDDPLGSSPLRNAVHHMACGVYQLFAKASRRRNILLVLLLLLFISFAFANIGGLSLITLYELNQPLCWNEILIGYGSALSTTVFLTSFVGVMAFSRCGVPNLAIILIGILSVMIAMTLVSFAKTTLVMFLGALFACVACLDTISNGVASIVFSSLYAVTVAWFPGFCFLLSAGLCVIPLALLVGVGLLEVNEDKEPSDADAIIPGEEDLSGYDNETPPLI
uniref:Solute carrier family 46 member 3 n=1 Tax=Esox lucius TaxID=8010 RepID=A0A3P8XWS2_ESOLU